MNILELVNLNHSMLALEPRTLHDENQISLRSNETDKVSYSILPVNNKKIDLKNKKEKLLKILIVDDE